MATADQVILGILSQYPCSGYDIKTELDAGGAGLLSGLSFGSIYPRLKELEQEGLIETYQADAGGRRKKLHELTGRGWSELSEWLAIPPEYPIPTRDELLLKMVFWGAARPEDRATLIEHLELRREQSLELLDRITEWPRNGVSAVSEYGMLIFDYFRSRLEAELAWIERAIAQLEGPPQPPAQDPRGLIPRQRERREAALAALSGEEASHDNETQAEHR